MIIFAFYLLTAVLIFIVFSSLMAYIFYADEMVDDATRIEVQLRKPLAKEPWRKRDTDAGWDVTALDQLTINPGDIVNVNCGMAVVAPPGFYFTVEGRSSMYAAGVVPFRGIIDATYTGDLTVTLMNVGTKSYIINPGDRVAQLVPHEILDIQMVKVDEISEEYKGRGTAGWGSSGK